MLNKIEIVLDKKMMTVSDFYISYVNMFDISIKFMKKKNEF